MESQKEKKKLKMNTNSTVF